MNKTLAILLLFGTASFAQTKPVQVGKNASSASDINVLKNPPSATLSEAVSNGTYLFQFADPNNKWRCYVTGYLRDNARNDAENALTSLSSFTVNCVLPHEVKETPVKGQTK